MISERKEDLYRVFLDDLKPEVKRQVLDFLGLSEPKEGNYDVVPLFVLTKLQEDKIS